MARRFLGRGKSTAETPKTPGTIESPAFAPTTAKPPSSIAELFGRAKAARRLTAQEVYAEHVKRLADGAELSPEDAAALEKAASEIGASPAEIEADIAGLRSLAKQRRLVAEHDPVAISAALAENGDRQKRLRAELLETERVYRVLNHKLKMRVELAQGLHQAELKLWRVLGGTPEHGEAVKVNEAMRRRVEAENAFAAHHSPPQLVAAHGPGGHQVELR
jgi:hypothetical protein